MLGGSGHLGARHRAVEQVYPYEAVTDHEDEGTKEHESLLRHSSSPHLAYHCHCYIYYYSYNHFSYFPYFYSSCLLLTVEASHIM